MKNFELEYKSALGTATTMYACAKESNDKEMVQSLELIFPELKKNKNEEIRKWLIGVIKSNEYGSISNVGEMPCSKPDIIAWLEKQGEQKLVEEPKQVWSPEDESMFACLWGILNWVEKSNYSSAKNVEKYIDWLQSLKQRLNGYE